MVVSRKSKVMLFVIGALTLATIILYLRDEGIHVIGDSWFHKPDSPKVYEWKILPKNRISTIRPMKSQEAVVMLESQPYVELDDIQLGDLIGPRLNAPDTRAFLVRALKIEHSTGTTDVYILDGKVWTRYGTLGSTRRNIIKDSVVVFLEEPPNELFCDVFIAH